MASITMDHLDDRDCDDLLRSATKVPVFLLLIKGPISCSKENFSLVLKTFFVKKLVVYLNGGESFSYDTSSIQHVRFNKAHSLSSAAILSMKTSNSLTFYGAKLRAEDVVPHVKEWQEGTMRFSKLFVKERESRLKTNKLETAFSVLGEKAPRLFYWDTHPRWLAVRNHPEDPVLIIEKIKLALYLRYPLPSDHDFFVFVGRCPKCYHPIQEDEEGEHHC